MFVKRCFKILGVTLFFCYACLANVEDVMLYNLIDGTQLFLISQNSEHRSDEESKDDANQVADALVRLAEQDSTKNILFVYEYPLSTYADFLEARMQRLQKTGALRNIVLDDRLEGILVEKRAIEKGSQSNFLKNSYEAVALGELTKMVFGGKSRDRIMLSLTPSTFKKLDEMIKKENLSYDRIQHQGSIDQFFSCKTMIQMDYCI